MDERKKQVLNAIIEDYIANAEPVGSRAVAKKYSLGVSPATIRNEMSDLEDEGYIEQPHTSAGRIPSDKSYRFYVDNLMEKTEPTNDETCQVRDALNSGVCDLDDFMRSCCNMISRLTNYPAMIAVPEQGQGKLLRLQLVPVQQHQVLVVLLASTGILRHKLIDMPFAINDVDLARIESELGRLLLGMEMKQLSYDFLREQLNTLGIQEKMFSQTMELLNQVLTPRTGQKILINGAMNMLSHPEFRDIEKLKSLFDILETEGKVKKLLDSSSEEALTVSIGGEIPDTDMHDCSMVVANYFINGEKAGSIGVLGPTRMSYGRTVSLMEFISRELSEALDKKKRG